MLRLPGGGAGPGDGRNFFLGQEGGGLVGTGNEIYQGPSKHQ